MSDLAQTVGPNAGGGALRPFQLGRWHVEPQLGRLSQAGQSISLEPKLMSLLVLLASEPERVFSRAELESRLWANVVVGEDTVARTISRLRRALGDSAQSPTYIETLSKRGYRMIAPVARNSQPLPPTLRRSPNAVLVAVAAGVCALALAYFILGEQASTPVLSQSDLLTSRANDQYMRFTRADNEAAIALYERALSQDPNHAGAQAGLANALVQRVVRWPHEPGSSKSGASTLADALDQGLTETRDARELLARASSIAERAVRLAPDDADALKALAFTYTAQGQTDRAIQLYLQAIERDANAWESMINLGEIYQMQGHKEDAIAVLENAFEAMERTYDQEPQRIGPWQAALGVLIGDKYEQLGRDGEAQGWYRRVLYQAPLQPDATVRLARLLRRAGDHEQATRLCQSLRDKVGVREDCAIPVGRQP